MGDSFRLIQDGLPCAWADGNGAFAEISHYAMVYSQDGPVAIEQRVKGKWKPFDLAPPETEGRSA